jgi:hypothetical protein
MKIYRYITEKLGFTLIGIVRVQNKDLNSVEYLNSIQILENGKRRRKDIAKIIKKGKNRALDRIHLRPCSVIPNTHGLDGIGKNEEEV